MSPKSDSRLLCVRAQIVRWVEDYPPGIVEARFTDCFGHEWSFIAKFYDVSDEGQLHSDSVYPRDGLIPCVVVSREGNREGREIVEVDTWDGISSLESTEGSFRFYVYAQQLVEVPNWLAGG